MVVGHKSPGERFAGAIDTMTIEAMMQDGKALQAGTSHFLGQNFAKSFDVQFTNKEGQQEYVWATSWGVSTRLMGALIMAHGDDNGLVLPPALAPIQVVMVPIYKSDEERNLVLDKMYEVKKALEAKGHSVEVDDRDNLRPGFKFAEWELKGVPVRLAMGPRDLQNGTVEVARRDTLEKITEPLEGLDERIIGLLDDIQKSIYQRAFPEEHLPARLRLPRRERPQGGHLGRVQGGDREGRIPALPLGRHRGDGSPDPGRDQGHDPLHSRGQLRRGRGRQVRVQRQAFAPARDFCKILLINRSAL